MFNTLNMLLSNIFRVFNSILDRFCIKPLINIGLIQMSFIFTNNKQLSSLVFFVLY